MTSIESSIGGLTFSVDPANPNGLGQLAGWYSAPPKRVEVDDYPNSDGASEVDKDYRSARIITQTGLMSEVSSDAAITGVWRAFSALQADGVPSPFTVTDAGGALSCQVSVIVADIEHLVNGEATYTLQMVARDPVKYGAASFPSSGLPTSGGGLEYELYEGGSGGALYYGANGALGRVTLTNAGTAAVWPSVTVTGELTDGFYLQRLDTGQIVRYDRVVPAGSTVFIDFRTGEVLVDGVSDGSTYLTGYDFWSVAPGESAEAQFNAIGGSSGTPTATWTIAPGFW